MKETSDRLDSAHLTDAVSNDTIKQKFAEKESIMRYFDYLTEFIFREDPPESADVIMVCGSGYGELAMKAAELYHAGYAKYIVVSGKYSILQDCFAGPVSPKEYLGKTYKTESEFLAGVLLDQGVPDEAVLQENRASFTFENAICTEMLLRECSLPVQKAILVCQAFHAKRSLMYFQLVFPEVDFFVCPAITQGITRENWYLSEHGIETVLGEVKRCGTQFTDILKGKDKVWKEWKSI